MSALDALVVPSVCEVDGAEMDSGFVTIRAHVRTLDGVCPLCLCRSVRIHSYYTRTIHDLPVSEYSVCLKLRVRRFRCENGRCQRQTFTEQLPELAAPHAQRTHRLAEAQHHTACFVSGEAGARLLVKLHMKVSGDTLLRLLRRERLPLLDTPRVLGIDDWAQRKGHTYGTILVDLERHQVVELLADRTAATLAEWLGAHPGVGVITRDRSTEYARGAREGAPGALQVADRWHLLANLRQVLERYLTQAHARLKQLPRQSLDAFDDHVQVVVPHRVPHARTENERRRSLSSRDGRSALYARIQELRREGSSIRSISEHLRLNRTTVRKFYYADSFPERSQRRLMPSILDPYLAYLEARHHEGCENASQLWREISRQGYPGTRSQVYKWVQQKRTQPATTTPGKYLEQAELEDRPYQQTRRQAPYVPPVRELTWLFAKSADTLTERERHILAWAQQDIVVCRLYELGQQFAAMVRKRQAQVLDGWLSACAKSDISCLLTFASGIQQDYSAVRAALETVWSNGQTEGQVNRLKLLKRQMYGRASFDLLRLKALNTA